MAVVYDDYRVQMARLSLQAHRQDMPGASWALGQEAHRAGDIADACRQLVDSDERSA